MIFYTWRKGPHYGFQTVGPWLHSLPRKEITCYFVIFYMPWLWKLMDLWQNLPKNIYASTDTFRKCDCWDNWSPKIRDESSSLILIILPGCHQNKLTLTKIKLALKCHVFTKVDNNFFKLIPTSFNKIFKTEKFEEKSHIVHYMYN